MTDHPYFAMLCAFVPTMAFGGLTLWTGLHGRRVCRWDR